MGKSILRRLDDKFKSVSELLSLHYINRYVGNRTRLCCTCVRQRQKIDAFNPLKICNFKNSIEFEYYKYLGTVLNYLNDKISTSTTYNIGIHYTNNKIWLNILYFWRIIVWWRRRILADPLVTHSLTFLMSKKASAMYCDRSGKKGNQ